MAPDKKFELAIIIPVYNECACIAEVVLSWLKMLDTLNIQFQMLVLNDGSTDTTAQALASFGQDPRVQIVNKPNAGHGPTILMGYRSMLPSADWLFQCDSDGEIQPDEFPRLWNQRDQYDALFGYRENRIQSRGRALISAVSRAAVKVLCGSGVRDVNTPYRLMRAELLEKFLEQIPGDTFAPNIIIAGEISRRNQRILNTPVSYQPRRTGQVSIVRWKLWKAAAKSLMQTVSYFIKHRAVAA